MKAKPTIVVQPRQDRTVESPDPDRKCSCGKRPIYKCIKENGHGTGKMCVK